jgi:hypothetical protein
MVKERRESPRMDISRAIHAIKKNTNEHDVRKGGGIFLWQEGPEKSRLH